MLDSSGRLIGVTTMIVSGSGASAGAANGQPVQNVAELASIFEQIGRGL